jgi:tetratricopeptide (TPR) repeat protein
MLLPCRGFTADDFFGRYYDLRENEIRQFSLDLFTGREYYRSITEAKRYISLLPEGPRSDEMFKLIGDAYLMSQEWAEAIAAYDEFLAQFPESSLANTVTFHKAVCLVKQGNPMEAERLFQFILSGTDPDRKEEAVRWEILLMIRQNRFEEAERFLRNGMVHPRIEKESGLITDLLTEGKNTSYKSPTTAGLLSAILPGSGHFYDERYQDGAYSFLLNALFIAGAWKSFDSGNYGLGGLLTLVELGWYTGGIYGAVGGAHKYNRQIDEDRFRNGLLRLNLRESEIGPPAGVSVTFTYPF